MHVRIRMAHGAPVQTVLSASVGGAAALPLDPEIWVAPMRDALAVQAAERRAAREPCDPWDLWPARRVGYGSSCQS